jgi:hypothetical protein
MDSPKLASGGVAVTPNDTTDLGFLAYGLWVGVGGTLKVDCAEAMSSSGAAARTTFATTVPAGWFPFKVLRVYATGTAATGIIAAYE